MCVTVMPLQSQISHVYSVDILNLATRLLLVTNYTPKYLVQDWGSSDHNSALAGEVLGEGCARERRDKELAEILLILHFTIRLL